MSEKGVPPLIELEKGVLVGSASPSIRTNIFRKKMFVLPWKCHVIQLKKV